MQFLGHFKSREKRALFLCEECQEERKGDCNLPHYGDEVEAHIQFTMAVEAEDIDEALKKFADKILRMRKEGNIFDKMEDVFLVLVQKIYEWPEKATLTNFSSVAWDGREYNGFQAIFRGVEGIETIVPAPDGVEDGDTEALEDGKLGSERLFITFENKRLKRRTRIENDIGRRGGFFIF